MSSGHALQRQFSDTEWDDKVGALTARANLTVRIEVGYTQEVRFEVAENSAV